MRIGMIGAGEVSKAIAGYALRAGHEVVVSNSGDDGRLAAAVKDLGEGATAGSVDEAAKADIVVLAVPWLRVADALPAIEDWRGAIVVDATNPFVELSPKPVLADLGADSASELVAARLPGARVVKAFNSVYMKRFVAGPDVGDARRVLFVSGDDDDAKSVVSELIRSFGFATLDLGSLGTGGRLQQAGGTLGGPDILIGG